MTILGIDPGTTSVGYGAIKKEGSKYKLLDTGLLKVNSKGTEDRLKEIEKSLKSLVEDINPDRVGVEEIFFSKNRKTAIKVAQARGVIMLTLSKNTDNIFEISPSQVKSAVTGNGNASKKSVAKMVKHFITKGSIDNLPDDATDAIAIAIGVSTMNNY